MRLSQKPCGLLRRSHVELPLEGVVKAPLPSWERGWGEGEGYGSRTAQCFPVIQSPSPCPSPTTGRGDPPASPRRPWIPGWCQVLRAPRCAPTSLLRHPPCEGGRREPIDRPASPTKTFCDPLWWERGTARGEEVRRAVDHCCAFVSCCPQPAARSPQPGKASFILRMNPV